MNAIYAENQKHLSGGVLVDSAAVLRHEIWQQEQIRVPSITPVSISLKIDEPIELALIFGFGSGDLVNAFANENRVKNILVFEPNELSFSAVCAQRDFNKIFTSNKIKLIVADTESAIKQRLISYFNEDMSRMVRAFSTKIFTSPGVDQVQSNKILFDKFLNVYQDLINSSTTSRLMPLEDSFRGLFNTAQNYPQYYNYPAIECFSDLYKNVPAILVGVGPSLDQTLPLLREISQRTIVIAVDVAVRKLLSAGIVPDYVTCMERAGTELFFKDLQPMPNTHLVAPSNVQPLTFERFPGPKIKFYRSCILDHWFVPAEHRHRVSITVGHLAFWLSRQLGCDPIYLIGHDFSYDPKSGSVYANTDNNFLEKGGQWMKKQVFSSTDFDVAGYDGEMHRTTELWHQFSELLGNQVALHGGEIRHILPMGYGIQLPYARRFLPEQAIESVNHYQNLEKGLREKTMTKKNHEEPYESISAPIQNRIKASLSYLTDQSLLLMNEATDFTINHSPLIFNQGYEEAYVHFFKKMENEQAKLLAYDNGFFDKYLTDYLGDHHSRIGIQMARLIATEKDHTTRVNSQMDLLYNWLEMIHLWCSRALKVLERRA